MLLSLRPEVDIPSRKTMSTRILDAGATLAEDEMKAIVKECEGVCVATDSWTSIRRRQIMAFVIITSERQALPHRSLDTTAERHFAEILCQHMLEEIEIVERDFETKVKAIITDAASDCRKARSLVVEQLPHILSLDCFAHQMNLLVGNYLKHEPMAAEAIKQAFGLINWWRWHLVPFEWLLAEMEHPLALLTGCLTRWGSQVAAIIRLLQFKEAMLVVLLRKKQAILDTIARREQRDKAEVLLSAAQKDDFWSSLAHLVQNLLPIRIALRVLESDSARLDSVLEQFGSMANHFSYSPLMMDSLEKRWAKMEQKLFLLAYVLHPARMLQHINPKLEFAYSCNIATYAGELYERLFSDSTAADSSEVFKQVACYLGMKGAFANSIPKYTNSKEDPGTFWSLMKQSTPQLARLATHLSQVAVNSAAVERLFSAFLNIQTKRRNKLVHERVHKIAAIKALLPVKRRPKKKPAGQQYLGRRPNNRGASLSGEAAQIQLTAASEKTQQQFLDGGEDMVEEAEQVQGFVDDCCQQVGEDEADDVEYVVQSSSTRCKLADLFVDMPAFDLELLFEDEVDPEAS